VTLLFIILGACLLYVILASYFARGIHNEYATRPDLPDVSIVVPVRNEEHCLHGLLDSLLAADYPPERMEIILVNDQSEDRTKDVALSYKSRFKCRYSVYDVMDEPDGKLVAKTRPLAQGLDHATGEIVLMTDADCINPPTWIRSMVSFFAPGVGMVCGTTLPHPELGARQPLTWFETLDWMFLLGACAGLAGRGRPLGLIGNNFSVRREAYLSLGTYRAMDFSDIDDLALMTALQETGRWRVVFPADSGVKIYTRPLKSLWQLVRQRRRWMKGAVYTGWAGMTVLGLGVVAHVTLPLWPVFIGWSFLLPFTMLAAGDSLVLLRMVQRYRTPRLMWLVPLYPVFASCYGIGLVALTLATKRVIWKSRKF
jgi:cellulose synthase/poly-beta-1,6-N-acetylglucosamine synthase-like glycosyltransferase